MAIERCFGQIKRRFPLLKNGLRFRKTRDSAHCIIACFILQNICIREYDQANFEEDEEPNEYVELSSEIEQESEETALGNEKRDLIRRLLQ